MEWVQVYQSEHATVCSNVIVFTLVLEFIRVFVQSARGYRRNSL